MGKDAYYFKHDSNAKDDPKCVLLIEQLGLEGYGIYWVLIETLRDQPDYRYPLSLLPAIARRYNTSTQKVEAVIRGYQLFDVDDCSFFFSQSLINRMKPWEQQREQARIAGIISAQKRLGNGRSTDVEQTLNRRSTKRREEKREEESKEDKKRLYDIGKYGTQNNVRLTDAEIEKLNVDYSSDLASEAIEFLSLWIAEKGDKSKSETHNLTIRRWVIDAVKERREKRSGCRTLPQTTQQTNDTSGMNTGFVKSLDLG